ncbi:Endonuclease III [Anaerohalosphaera lusitana]|uniref:Endonuclease III n=1 Tax=Anaerohalosphaera lusitana TaxID=1936003 RepID=A0A1U9NIH8_9BACT|nr:endonuclease III domain-containing protein [Anaerohalosphaera lusitana]AQT67548.1 Endonuclease III [Anaerohalosphaera lusitana]
MNYEKLMEVFNLMHDRYGPQKWWPGDSEYEVAVGAILTQNTNWRNVESALENLKNANSLDPFTIDEMPAEQLATLIRPAGYYNVKAKRLKNFNHWLITEHDGQIEQLNNKSIDTLREELLSVNGIGRETADSIILYAVKKPTFVVDAYTCRIMLRHQFIDPYADYEQVKDFFESCLPADVELFNEYHALLVQVGKNHCKPKAKCAGCPLESLPHELDPMF